MRWQEKEVSGIGAHREIQPLDIDWAAAAVHILGNAVGFKANIMGLAYAPKYLL